MVNAFIRRAPARMAELWELICHHTYRGIPGVVADLAPLGVGHGHAQGLDDGDFLIDGASPASGAVQFYKQYGRIHVPAHADEWRTIGGVKAEVTVRRGVSHPAFLIYSNAFQLYIRGEKLNGWFNSQPLQYAQVNSAWDPVASPYLVPDGQWVTLGFLHDGFGTIELYADGQCVGRRTGTYTPVTGVDGSGVSIGNASSGGAFLNGEIDEVKIWRLNPRRLNEDFFARPMDSATAECWKRLIEEIEAAFQRHPDCGQLFKTTIANALEGLIRQAMAKGPETRQKLEDSARQYQRLWREGRVDSPEMATLFADLIGWLKLVGLDLSADPGLVTLANSQCLSVILGEISRLDCDEQARKLLESIAGGLGFTPKRPSAAE
jgi:hypothetical protein